MTEVTRAHWFAAVGEEADPHTRQLAERYVQALPGARVTAIKMVDSWQDAMQLLREYRWDEDWVQAEQAETGRLLDQVRKNLGAREAAVTLASSLDGANDLLLHCAREALDEWAIVDDEWARVAAGAAGQALYQDTLATLAGAGPEHVFRVKYELWQRGRWPLGVFKRHLQLF
ncbi:MAG: hypothetical protein AB1768_04295 [Pseudomonadota bacterium]